MLLAYGAFVLSYIICLAKVSEGAQCIFRNETLDKECDWSSWLPWSCSSCNGVPGSMAKRQRAICCADGISKDWCLRVCGYNQTDDVEYAVCSIKCKISHNSGPITTDTTAESFSFSTVLRVVSSFVQSSNPSSTLLLATDKTTPSRSNSMFYSLYTNQTTGITIKTTDISSSDLSQTSIKQTVLNSFTAKGITTERLDTTNKSSTEYITSSNHKTTDKRKRSDPQSLEHSTASFRTSIESVTTNNEYSTELFKKEAFTPSSTSLSEHSTSLNALSAHNNGAIDTVVTPRGPSITAVYANAATEELSSRSSVTDSLKSSTWKYFVKNNISIRQNISTLFATEQPSQPRRTSYGYTGRDISTSKPAITEASITQSVLMTYTNFSVTGLGHFNKTSRNALKNFTTAKHKPSSKYTASGTFSGTTIAQVSSKRPNGSFDTLVPSKATKNMHAHTTAHAKVSNELQSKTGSSKSFPTLIYASPTTMSYPRQSTSAHQDHLTTKPKSSATLALASKTTLSDPRLSTVDPHDSSTIKQPQIKRNNTAELKVPETTTEQTITTSAGGLDAKQVVINHKTGTSENGNCSCENRMNY